MDIISEWEEGRRRAPNLRVVERSSTKDFVTVYFPEGNVLVPMGFSGRGIQYPGI